MRRSVIPFALPPAVSILTIEWLHLHTLTAPPPAGTDPTFYTAMARSPFAATPLTRTAPFCWRVLMPLVVHAVPLPVSTAFFVCAVVFVALTTIAVVYLMRALEFDRITSGAAGVAAALMPTHGYLAWDFVRVDPLATLLIAVAAAAVVARRPVLLVAALALGGLTKESILVGAVFAIGWTWQRRDGRMAAAAWVGVAAMLAGALAVRWLVHPATGSYSSLAIAMAFYLPLSARALARRALLGTASTWAVLLPVAARPLCRRSLLGSPWPWLAAVIVAMSQMLVAIDSQRLVGAAMPFVIAAAAAELSRIPSIRLRAAAWAALIAGEAPWLLWYAGVAPPMPHVRLVEAVLFLAALAAAAAPRDRRKEVAGPPA